MKRKSTIYRQGEDSEKLYFIKSGKVKISKCNSEGKEFSIQVITEGSFLGYKAIIDGEKFSETATIVEDAVVVIVGKDEFLKLLSRNRNVSIEFIKILNSQNESNENKLLSMAFDSVRKRTANVLFDLYEKFQKSEDETQVPINISRDDLASLVGTATETVIRCLSDLKDEGVIDIQGRKILVQSKERLIKVCS